MWVEGRQGGRYFKWKLLESKLFKFDVYLLRFEPDANIVGHRDEVPEGYEHHRLNIVLRKSRGNFWTINKDGSSDMSWRDKRIHKFIASETTHGMVIGGERNYNTGYWLSFGWLRKKPPQIAG